MDKKIMELMKLQGKLRVRLIYAGVDSEIALHVAASIMEMLAASGLMKDEYAAALKEPPQATEDQP